MNSCQQINSLDNVAVALQDLPKGFVLEIADVKIPVLEDIPAGHKIALKNFSVGENIVKYGAPIGHAIKEIKAGYWVNQDNIKTNLEGLSSYKFSPQNLPQKASHEKRFFKGYRRKNGEVGIRNEIWIVPTVGCVNGIANKLAETLRSETELKNIDAIQAFGHNYGCSQLGDDHENTRKILRDIVLHPNAGGVLVVGLGCENNQLSTFKELLGEFDENRICFMEVQKVDDEFETGMNILRSLYNLASKDEREDVPLSELKVGLKCGGSDGFSGITANPLLGYFSDFLVAQGGTTVLTEVPEMFGAEHLLMNRCKSEEVFEKAVKLINDFKTYFIKNEQPIYENPSPGNKAGGISTLEEKSLGCTQKSGSSKVCDVLFYGDRLKEKGLNLLSASGNDLVASTALASASCHLVLFTTGRGTPFGTFVPTLKVSTNSTLAQKKPHWIDFDAGEMLEASLIEKTRNDFIDFVISVASGKLTNNEKNGYREIAIFKSGVTL